MEGRRDREKGGTRCPPALAEWVEEEPSVQCTAVTPPTIND